MSTFQQRVEAYIGTVTSDNASDWLTAGYRFMIDLLPEHILNEYAVTVSVSTGGIDAYKYRIWKRLKNGYEAPQIDNGLMTAVQDENSIHYAINRSPVSLLYNGKLYIYPNGGEVLALAYSTVNASNSTMSGFPDRMLQGMILYASIQGALSKAGTALTSFGSISLPTAPSAPSFSFTDVTGQTITLPTLTSYTKPTTTFSSTNLSNYINSSSEDVDLSTAEATHQKVLLEKFQMDLYNELNEVNAEIESIKIQLQRTIEQARLAQEAGMLNSTKDLEAAISQYSSSLNKYQSELQSYSSQSNSKGNLAQSYLVLVEKLKVEFNDFISAEIGSNG